MILQASASNWTHHCGLISFNPSLSLVPLGPLSMDEFWQPQLCTTPTYLNHVLYMLHIFLPLVQQVLTSYVTPTDCFSFIKHQKKAAFLWATSTIKYIPNLDTPSQWDHFKLVLKAFIQAFSRKLQAKHRRKEDYLQ
jgi:hypothetical protein